MADVEEQAEINTKFKIKMEELSNLVEEYRNRNFDEDLKSIKGNYGGIEGLADKLHTDPKNGIVPTDLEERDQAFGSNKKEVAKRNSF